MEHFYTPLAERLPDWQYQSRLAYILAHGVTAEKLFHGINAKTAFGELLPMRFDLRNGVPLITERALPSWKSAIAEIIAFINGARTIDEIESYGVNKAFWGQYRGKGTAFGLAPDDMGPGSYGPAFHDHPSPLYGGTSINQFQQLLYQLKEYPYVRTLRVTPWIAGYTASGPNRRVIVAPCHGELHFRVLRDTEGVERLYMRMDQRSGDMPIGVPHNMIQYAALLLMICQVTGYKPGNYMHSFSDAHIYDNQIDKVKELIERPARKLPTLHLDPEVKDLFKFRIEHFELREYDPHPKMEIPFVP